LAERGNDGQQTGIARLPCNAKQRRYRQSATNDQNASQYSA
jgi:hypothetical protein